MAKTILCVLALVVATLAYPADEVVPQVPQKTQVVAQLEVRPADTPVKEQPAQEPVKNIPVQEPIKVVQVDEAQIQQRAQEVQKIEQEVQEAQAYEEAIQDADEIKAAHEELVAAEEAEAQNSSQDIPPGGVVGSDVASTPEANPAEDKSDLEGANTFWGGWGRRWGGYGGYYYPRRHYSYGYGRGYGHGHYGHYGYGRGYGGWGGYYW